MYIYIYIYIAENVLVLCSADVYIDNSFVN